MNTIKNKYSKIYGYIPTDSEILELYFLGQLILTDKEENQILKYFNL